MWLGAHTIHYVSAFYLMHRPPRYFSYQFIFLNHSYKCSDRWLAPTWIYFCQKSHREYRSWESSQLFSSFTVCSSGPCLYTTITSRIIRHRWLSLAWQAVRTIPLQTDTQAQRYLFVCSSPAFLFCVSSFSMLLLNTERQQPLSAIPLLARATFALVEAKGNASPRAFSPHVDMIVVVDSPLRMMI